MTKANAAPTSNRGRTKVLERMLEQGQSVWLDQLTRELVRGGDLQALIERDGLRGMTSNPTIFEKALAAGRAYDEQIATLAEKGSSPEEIFEAIAVQDVRDACDLFRPLHEKTACLDGYVSIEVSPSLARDRAGTVAEARRLWSLVDRPNVMIKVPGTREAVPAIEQLLVEGVNVNVTLLFARANHERVMEAWLNALEDRAAAGKPITHLASVASFFVSRVDKVIDAKLEALDPATHPDARSLVGKSAVANAKLAYANFRRVCEGPRFTVLKTRGARVQRPLWASTSPKNPAFRDVLYVEELIGADTVDTMPLETLRAMIAHGSVRCSVDQDLAEARATEAKVQQMGISLDDVTTTLEEEGIASFAKSYEALLSRIAQKAEGFRGRPRRR